jgi:hypothetical protein
MRKSRSIQLTVVAALGMAARAQQGPTTPSVPAASAAPQTCEERRSTAQAGGVAFNESCGHSTPAHGVARKGFGSTATAHTGGG